jgi:NADH-quinone oxidoreductase subunit J
MTLQVFLFWLIAAATVISALAVVVSQNIVRAATWLLFTLAGVSGLFFLLGADLVGATQLLIYVGGTLVLVVFSVMLTAQGPFITMKTGAAEWAVSALVGLLFFAVLAITAHSVGHRPQVKQPGQARLSDRPADSSYTTVIGEGFLGVGVGPVHKDPAAKILDYHKPMRISYLLPFEIVSVHLLVVLIGAAYLARAKRKRRAAA